MHRLGLALAWLLVASAATGLTWGVLSTADREIAEGPLTQALIVADTPAPDTTTGPSVPASDPQLVGDSPALSTSPVAGVPVVPSFASPSSTVPSTTTSTTAADNVTSTTTTTSTTVGSGSGTGWTKLTVPSAGGVVVVSHRPGEVRLESAAPAVGFTMEVDKAGPEVVEVEFDSATSQFEVRIRWDDGVLDTEVVSG